MLPCTHVVFIITVIEIIPVRTTSEDRHLLMAMWHILYIECIRTSLIIVG